MGIAALDPSYARTGGAVGYVRRMGSAQAIPIKLECGAGCRGVRPPSAYLIAAKASTCNSKSGLDNCGARTVVLFGEGGPK